MRRQFVSQRICRGSLPHSRFSQLDQRTVAPTPVFPARLLFTYQLRSFGTNTSTLLNKSNTSGVGVSYTSKATKPSASTAFDPKDLDVESLQHPYWDTDLDFFVPYADDEVGDEGPFSSFLDEGNEGDDEGLGRVLETEASNIPADGRKLLRKEWQ